MTKTSLIHDDFLLTSKQARELYHRYAKSEPIYDYHCHLPPDLIASNHQFADLSEIWLGGDHYKWRALRANVARNCGNTCASAGSRCARMRLRV